MKNKSRKICIHELCYTACFILEDSSATNYEIQLGLQNEINESENLQN